MPAPVPLVLIVAVALTKVAPLAHFMSMPSNHFYQLFAPRDISWSWAHYLHDVLTRTQTPHPTLTSTPTRI